MEELVEVTFVADEYEGAMIQALLEERGIPSLQQRVGVDGSQLGYAALTGGGSRRVMVHADRAEEARAILGEAESSVEGFPEPANADYLADAQGRRPRNFTLIGGLSRAIAVSLLVLIVAFGLFTLVRAL